MQTHVRTYGSTYPLDDVPEMARRTLPRWIAGAGVRVRFYVEGDTEQGALEYGLRALLGYGVEVVNLFGRDWAESLAQELANDRAAKRFSLLMLDGDRSDPLRAVSSHVKHDLVTGRVFVNRPDVEFGCFDIPQLVKAAVIYENQLGMGLREPPDPAAFSATTTGKEFEALYKRLRQSPGLKGKTWGQALMRAAILSQSSPDDESHPLIKAVMWAQRGTSADYEAHAARYAIDHRTLALVVRNG